MSTGFPKFFELASTFTPVTSPRCGVGTQYIGGVFALSSSGHLSAGRQVLVPLKVLSPQPSLDFGLVLASSSRAKGNLRGAAGASPICIW
jgi:hypothetical protein